MNIEIKMPDIGSEAAEVTEVLVHAGERVKKEMGLIVVEGQKTSMEIPSPYEGIITEIKVKIGDQVKTGALIMILNFFEKKLFQDQKNKDIPSIITSNNNIKNKYINNAKDDVSHNNKDKNVIHASPVIRRLAREFNIDLKNIIGTGPKKRILKEDVENYQTKNFNNAITIDKNISKSILSANTITNIINNTEDILLTKIQQASGNNLHKNWNNVPHVTQFDESDITELEEFRIKYNSEIKEKKHDIKLTLLVFIIKALSNALKKFPYFNSSLSNDHKKLILKKYVNIGIAVNTNYGLVVPVLKDTNIKNILEIATELKEISEKARNNTLTLLDMKDGCFTISNLGAVGGTTFTPIINVPEVGILGVSKAVIKPIWNQEKFIPRLMLPLSLSYDHRVIDGVYAANFIVWIKNLLSDIRLIMI